jgi:RNA polymerase sigma-70 factor (ECF subfamily)
MADLKRYEEFSTLVRIHTGQILAYLDTLLLNWSDAEDLFQETCVVLWQKFDEYGPESNFLAWALRIADFKAMNFQQKQTRRRLFVDGLRDTLMAELATQTPKNVDDYSLDVLSNCMEQLSQSDRQVVTMCYAEEESVRHIADITGRSPQSVHNSLRRIRNWLLECVRRQLRRADANLFSLLSPTEKEPEA